MEQTDSDDHRVGVPGSCVNDPDGISRLLLMLMPMPMLMHAFLIHADHARVCGWADGCVGQEGGYSGTGCRAASRVVRRIGHLPYDRLALCSSGGCLTGSLLLILHLSSRPTSCQLSHLSSLADFRCTTPAVFPVSLECPNMASWLHCHLWTCTRAQRQGVA